MPKESVDTKIDKLAFAVAKGFDEVHTKMNSGFEEVRNELKVLNIKIDKLDAKVTGTNGRVEVLEDQMRLVRTKLDLR